MFHECERFWEQVTRVGEDDFDIRHGLDGHVDQQRRLGAERG